MKNKRGIELSFNWIFSLVVGATILFLAIYAVSELVSTEQKAQSAIGSQELGNLLHPLETSLESGSRPENISFPGKARIYNTCYTRGQFGVQEISAVQESGIGREWPKPENPKRFATKYIFSENILEEREFYAFVKPVQLPFKIGDIIILWTKPYCFVNPPAEVEEEIDSLGLASRKIQVASSISACARNSTSVCFSGFDSKCNIVVDTSNNYVIKDKQNVFYEGPLLYGAIFAEPGLYECQVARLLKRGAFLAELYREKSELISTSAQGCSLNLQRELSIYRNIAINGSSKDLQSVADIARSLSYQNENLICGLWGEK